MTTFLVTGGAGFIGSHLCDRLLAEGSRVVAVDDLSTGHVGNLAQARAYGQRFTFYSVDIGAEGLGALFVRYQPEVVYHLAACRPKPPEAVTETSGTCRSAALSHARANFSPTTRPIEPPMNEKSMTASSRGAWSSVACPITIASPRPVATSASASRSV